MKKRIAFIINPISGGINKQSFPELVKKYLDHDKFTFELHYTSSSENNKELAEKCVKEKYDVLIAVGGDGTINNTASFVAGTDIIFGIIPQGSGNGLARHLNISSDIKEAIGIINRLNIINIDTGTVNDVFFINVAGVGFDAHVSWLFAKAPKRGFSQYAKITFKEFSSYKARTYNLVIDGKEISRPAFIVCAANGSQYGNNAYIAPYAVVNDGFFEITIIKPFNILQAIALGLRMFNKTLHRSPLVEIVSGKHLIIKRNKNEVINVDGEPVMNEKDLDIRINPLSLKIITP